MANIPGIAARALIMTESDWPKFREIVSRSSHLKKRSRFLAALELPNKHAGPDEQ